jgi:ubiquinone/menaquinone biosynthesis C-methylase UbiE
MSTYENYDATSVSYDGARVAIGLEIIAGAFAVSGKRLHEMSILDAGCGTGSYSAALLPLVSKIHAIDASAGMLSVARAKLGNDARVTLTHGDLRQLDALHGLGSFDGIMMNQVLHHIEAPEAVLGALARRLVPGGVLVVNTCSREQIMTGFWPASLVPEAAARMADRYLPLDRLEASLRRAGLEVRGRFVPADAICGGAAHFDARGPLRKEWRDTDSLWALVTPEELERALAKVRELDGRGELDAWMQALDEKRPSVGQTTFVVAAKTSAFSSETS